MRAVVVALLLVPFARAEEQEPGPGVDARTANLLRVLHGGGLREHGMARIVTPYLERLVREGFAGVRNGLDAPDDIVQRWCIRSLGRFPEHASEAVPLLLGRLASANDAHRLAALEALGRLGPLAAGGAAAIAARLCDPGQGVRLAACAALARVRPDLAQAMQEVQDMVTGRVGAWSSRSISCGMLPIPAAVDPRRERKVLDALAGLASPMPAVRVDALQDLSRACTWPEMARLRDNVLPSALGALHDRSALVRLAALDLLSRLGDLGSVGFQRVAALLVDPDGSVRKRAVQELAASPEELQASLLPALVRAMRDMEPSVRNAACRTLPAFGEHARGASAALLRLLADPDAGVRLAAAGALVVVQPSTRSEVRALADGLRDPENRVAAAVAQALAALGPEAEPVVPLLLQARMRDERVRLRVVEALAAIAPERPEVLLAMLEGMVDPYEPVQSLARDTVRGLLPAPEDPP